MDFTSPQLDPQLFQILIQAVGIQYTEVEPTHTPNKDVEAWIYFDATDYWLYVWANGDWRTQKLGITQQAPLSLQVASIQVTVPAHTNVDTAGNHDFGFVAQMVFGTMSGGGTTVVNYFGLWIDGQHNQTSIVTDGHGNSSSQFVGADDSLYLRDLSVSDTTLTYHYKNTGTSGVTVTLWIIGASS